MEEKLKIPRAMGAGLVATALMTLVVLAAPLVGLPKSDYFSMVGSLLGGQFSHSETWTKTLGIIWHFNFGVVLFPHLYVFALYPVLPGRPWMKGLQFGVGLWALLELVAMPMMGAGILSLKTVEPTYNVLGALLIHLVYGVVLGGIAGRVRETVPEAKPAVSAVTGGPAEDMNGMPPNVNPGEAPVYDGATLKRAASH